MKTSINTLTLGSFVDELNNGGIDFDYPIQRSGGQWDKDNYDASLLMHSFMAEYPVPPVYALVSEITVQDEDGNDVQQPVYSILDGKQRLTYVQKFVTNSFALHVDTPPVKIMRKRKVIEIEVAGQTFDQLNADVKNEFLNYELSMVQINSATDEEIENIFFRLNNGTALTKTQQGKSIMGSAWSKRFIEAAKHPAMTKNAQFTVLQKKKADDETTIIQTMMIMDTINHNYDLKSISSNHAFDYVSNFKSNEEHYLALFNRVMEGLDYIHEAFGNNAEKFLLKKVHMTSAIMTALHCKNIGVAPVRFKDWTAEFEKTYKTKGDYIKSPYKNDYTGQGSVSKFKALGRVKAMIEHLETYLAQSKVDTELLDAVDSVKENLEVEVLLDENNAETTDVTDVTDVTETTTDVTDEIIQDEIIEIVEDEIEIIEESDSLGNVLK